jgi:MYXO-CTERM domain-containing protein
MTRFASLAMCASLMVAAAPAAAGDTAEQDHPAVDAALVRHESVEQIDHQEVEHDHGCDDADGCYGFEDDEQYEDEQNEDEEQAFEPGGEGMSHEHHHGGCVAAGVPAQDGAAAFGALAFAALLATRRRRPAVPPRQR